MLVKMSMRITTIRMRDASAKRLDECSSDRVRKTRTEQGDFQRE